MGLETREIEPRIILAAPIQPFGIDSTTDFIEEHIVSRPFTGRNETEIIEDFTLDEMMDFHFSFKPYLPGMDANKVKEILDLKVRKSKPIRQYSSGMKQRVKLALAFFSDVPLLLLDEPVMNLDKAGIDWYLQLVKEYAGKRTLVICSNQHAQESAFAVKTLQIEDYKS